MDLTTLHSEIVANKIKPFYVFYGSELKVQDIYIEQMAKKIGNILYIDSVVDILPQLKNKSFLRKKTLYVVRDDKAFMSDEKLMQNIESLLSENTLVLRISSVDKRTKFYKTMQSSFVEFLSLTESVLKRYIKNEIQLSDRNIGRLISACESNYGRILLEIDKILCFGKVTGRTDYDAIFESFLVDNVINISPYDAIFDCVDCAIKMQSTRAFDLLEQCYEIGESTLTLLSVLYTNVKQLLQVKSYKGNDIERATGLTKWQIKNARQRVDYRTVSDLVFMLKLIRKIEVGIKTGKIEEQYAMQYLLVNIL